MMAPSTTTLCEFAAATAKCHLHASLSTVFPVILSLSLSLPFPLPFSTEEVSVSIWNNLDENAIQFS